MPIPVNWVGSPYPRGRGSSLKNLPKRLRAYHHEPLTNHKVVILIDKDKVDCRELKNKLERYVAQADLVSKKENPSEFQVVTRIVTEELESWFLGDFDALNRAFPAIPTSLRSKSKYRNPDLLDKPSETLHSILKKYDSEYRGENRLLKCSVAGSVAPYMEPEINRSESFQCFCEGVKACCSCRN